MEKYFDKMLTNINPKKYFILSFFFNENKIFNIMRTFIKELISGQHERKLVDFFP